MNYKIINAFNNYKLNKENCQDAIQDVMNAFYLLAEAVNLTIFGFQDPALAAQEAVQIALGIIYAILANQIPTYKEMIALNNAVVVKLKILRQINAQMIVLLINMLILPTNLA